MASDAQTTAEEFFSDGQTYERDIRLGDRVEQVTLRPLSAGDKADITDAVRISIARAADEDDEGAEGSSAELRIGAQRLLTVNAAVVAWTLPKPKSLSTVRALHPSVFDQIYAEVSWGGIPVEEPKETPESPLAEPNAS